MCGIPLKHLVTLHTLRPRIVSLCFFSISCLLSKRVLNEFETMLAATGKVHILYGRCVVQQPVNVYPLNGFRSTKCFEPLRKAPVKYLEDRRNQLKIPMARFSRFSSVTTLATLN